MCDRSKKTLLISFDLMSRRLEEAIELVRSLPKEEQDKAAELVFVYFSSEERQGFPEETEAALMQR